MLHKIQSLAQQMQSYTQEVYYEVVRIGGDARQSVPVVSAVGRRLEFVWNLKVQAPFIPPRNWYDVHATKLCTNHQSEAV